MQLSQWGYGASLYAVIHKAFPSPSAQPEVGSVREDGGGRWGGSQGVWTLAPKGKWGWACLGKAEPALRYEVDSAPQSM